MYMIYKIFETKLILEYIDTLIINPIIIEIFEKKPIPADNKDLKELEDTVNENRDEIINVFA